MTSTVEKLCYDVVGKAMEVHRELGPGVDEVFYHQLLSEKLRGAGTEHLFKPRQALVHRGHTADIFEPDIVFPGHLVTELKWLWGDFTSENLVQLTSYLKFWRIEDGLLLDFGKESLGRRFFAFTEPPCPPMDMDAALEQAPPFLDDRVLARRLLEATARLSREYGLCYRDTTYRGLLNAEFLAEGMACTANPTATVRAATRALGESRLPCLAVENQCAVMVLSMRDEIRAADRAILQSWLRHLGLRWGLIVNFGKRTIQLRWAHAPPHSKPT
jgi:GxxExxY protein